MKDTLPKVTNTEWAIILMGVVAVIVGIYVASTGAQDVYRMTLPDGRTTEVREVCTRSYTLKRYSVYRDSAVYEVKLRGTGWTGPVIMHNSCTGKVKSDSMRIRVLNGQLACWVIKDARGIQLRIGSHPPTLGW